MDSAPSALFYYEPQSKYEGILLLCGSQKYHEISSSHVRLKELHGTFRVD